MYIYCTGTNWYKWITYWRTSCVKSALIRSINQLCYLKPCYFWWYYHCFTGILPVFYRSCTSRMLCFTLYAHFSTFINELAFCLAFTIAPQLTKQQLCITDYSRVSNSSIYLVYVVDQIYGANKRCWCYLH